MSRSNRGKRNQALGADITLLAVAILCCITGLGFGYLEGYQDEARDHRSYEYAEAAKRNAIVACAEGEPSAVANCVYDEIASAREQAQGEQDLDAQQWMARWAMILTVITAATTIISWIALRYLRDTFRMTAIGARAAASATRAMVRQNDIAEYASRPWVAIEILAYDPFEITKERFSTKVHFEISNVGQSPAHRVQILDRICRMSLTEGAFQPFLQEQIDQYEGSEWGQILVPGQKTRHTVTIDLPKADFDLLNLGGRFGFTPTFFVAATYTRVGSTKPHQTGIGYLLGGLRNGHFTVVFDEVGTFMPTVCGVSPMPNLHRIS